MTVDTGLVPRGQCTVHCFDGAQSRDFSCKTEVLCSSMRYFRGHLKDVQPQQDVMISVHCDVKVFEWLLAFAQSSADLHSNTPQLTVPSVMPILIASNFLGMDMLVGLCLHFVAAHVLEVASVSRDLAALPTELLQRLAQVVKEEQLEQLHACASNSSCSQASTETDVVASSTGSDSHAGNKDQGNSFSETVPQSALQHLVGRLFKHKIEGLLRELQTTVVRCRHCGAMFSLAEQQKLGCSVRDGANAWLSGSSRKHLGHEPDHSWRLQGHIAALRAVPQDAQCSQGEPSHPHGPVSWRDIYWDVWGVVHVLLCSHCSQYYPAQQQSMCCYHPEPALYAAGKSVGRHPCCGATAQRSGDLALFSGGCCMRDHQPRALLESTAGHKAGSGHMASDQGPHSAAYAGVVQLLQSFRHLVVPETSGTLISSPLAPGLGPSQDHDDMRYEQGAPPADPELLVGGSDNAAAAGGQRQAAGRASPEAAYARSNSRNSMASINQLASGSPPSIAHVRQLYGSVSKTAGSSGMRARPTSPGPSSLGSQVSVPQPSRHSTTSILAPGSLSDDGGPASRATSRPDPCEPGRSASLPVRQPQAQESAAAAAAAAAGGRRAPDSADVPAHQLLQSSFSAQAFLQEPPTGLTANSITALRSTTTGQLSASPRQEKTVVSPRGPHALSSLANSASPQRAVTAMDREATCNVAAVMSRAAYGSHALGVSLAQLSGAAGSQPGCTPCAPPQLCQQAARKLRMELLHEDDNARMASLISHLVACRPTMPQQGGWVGAVDTASRTGCGSAKQPGALQPARAVTGNVQAGRSSRSGNTATRSISAARPSRDGTQTVVAHSRGHPLAASVQAGVPSAAGVPRPSSAPRMRPSMQPWPAMGLTQGVPAAYRGGGILGQHH